MTLTMLVSAGSGAGPACDLTQLQLRDSTVNQGLGSYDRLVRGKETLVRMYFSMPSCADNRSSIQVTGGTLSATGAGTTIASGISGTPTPVNVFPTAATYSAAPVNDTPADVKFVVPGPSLAPGATTNSFTASFSASITFQYKTSSNATPVAGTKTFSSFTSKPVEKKTNALRVLVVPMGNASNSYASEFPAGAVAAVENGMQALSRIYPVPSGVSTLGSNTGGLRYAIDSTLLNVTTPFCGTGANFDAIKAQLAQFLLSWNTANPTAQADRVIGAVWSGNSKGSADNCAEGMASVISPESWVRAFPDTPSPSMTGALFAMEISHTFGLTPAARSFGGFHSLNAAADGTAPNRGYNVTTRSFLADDRTAMNLGGTWNNNTTILEKEDWVYLLCALGGQTNTECTTSSVAGTVGGVAAFSGAFTASGTTDGTAAGTAVQESFAASDLVGLGTESTSDYKLVQRSASNSVLQTNGVRVSFNESHHDASPGVESRPKGTFAFVLSRNISAEKFELWKGAVGTGTLLWSTQKTNAPTITSFTAAAAGATNYTNLSPASDTQPAFTDDAAWLAWTRNGRDIEIGPATDSSKAVTAPKPPLAGTNGLIAFERSGDIYTMFADPQLAARLVASNGSQPAWSPDGSEIAFTRGGDIWVMNADGSNQRQLTNNAAQERSPAYGPDGRIAFVREDATDGEIWVMNGNGTGQAQLTNNGAGDEHPAWSPNGQLIAFDSTRSTGGQWRIYTTAPDGSNQTQLPNSVDGDLAPAWSPTGDRLAFYNACGCNGIELDLFVIGADGTNRTQITSTTGVGEFNPTWSGDGTQLTFFSGPLSASLTLSGPTEVEIINADGTGRQNITNDEVDDLYPNWQMIRPAAEFPALIGSGDKTNLAFVTEGDIYTIPVDLSGAVPRFGLSGPGRVYDANGDNRPDASHPTWSLDATQMAFAGAGSILLLDLRTGQQTALTATGGDSWPSWSRTPGVNQIAFVRSLDSGGDEIWAISPTTQSAGLVTSGSNPSYGTDGRIAFMRDGDIWVFEFGDPGVEEQVFGSGFQPALVSDTYAFVRNFVLPGTEFFENDIMIGRPGSGVAVNAQVTDDNPNEDRLDLLVICPGRTYVGAVALKPDAASGTSASWQANFDPSLTCANPTLKLAVSDGYNRVVSGSGESVQAGQKSPTAAIYSPSPGSTFLQYQLVPARGAGWDPEDGTLPDAKLQWKLDGPSGFSATGGGTHVDFSAPAGGFPLGSYTLTLTVTDSAGNADTATRSFTVVGDADNDGMSTTEEAESCITFNSTDYPAADQDPLNAFRDDDNDGLENIVDPFPCVAASEYEASIVFDPASMQRGSQGVVTANITVPNRQATDISDAYVKSINGIDVSTNAALRAKQLIIVRGTNTAQAKIDRTPLNAFFVAHNITAGQSVRIVIAGSSSNGTWTFEGAGTLKVT